MAGGLLNIVALGNNNIFLTGNPTKTFFKVTYAKYSNFGLQKFRIDYSGSRDLRRTEPSKFSFKIPRYADLLMDTYVVVTIPDIWSPVFSPCEDNNYEWVPYEFKWIDDLGTYMIKEVEITCGSLVLQKYSGEYLASLVERDFTAEKKDLYNKMTGNIPEFNDPAYSFGRRNAYPSAKYTPNVVGSEPSIRGRDLYIPINTWFTLHSACAFPLIALQYNELEISITMRPIQDLFQVRDPHDKDNVYPYVRPDFNEPRFQLYRFLQTPPAIDLSTNIPYENKVQTWNADIHLMSTYCFLSKDETEVFAAKDQVYLVKDVFEYKFENISGTKRVKLDSNGMVSSWTMMLQRNDVNLRNEGSNYTNWPYRTLPVNVSLVPNSEPSVYDKDTDIAYMDDDGNLEYYNMSVNPKEQTNTGIVVTGDYSSINRKEILESMGILLNGEYRENTMTRGVYDYIEKYTRTQGNAKDGIYCYNFCLNTSPFVYQPSGAINTSKFKTIELEVTTYTPTIDNINSNYEYICNEDGEPIGVRKSNWRLFEYNYNLTVYEERYNVLSFVGGNCGMLYSR